MAKSRIKDLKAKLLTKAHKTTVPMIKAGGNLAPLDREGKEGELTIRLVNGAITLYAKFRGKWYSIVLS